MLDWSLRHCSRHGHVTYRPDETDLARGLSSTTDLGDVWRCLRCGDFLLGEPVGSGPAAAAPDVPRGHALRDRLIIRSLAVERAARAVMLFIGAYPVWRLKSNQTRSWASSPTRSARGGYEAFKAEHASESLLTVTRSATVEPS
ncbi:MAG: hypothetical protein NTZ03_03710 [Actinobacteria bacterium]|nr:hypothetical protein [Actinomycetota bacterium]